MSKLVFELDDAAEAEFYNLVDYYKQLDFSLSSDFIYEFDQTVQRLLDFPEVGGATFMVLNVLFYGGSRMPLCIKFIVIK